MDIHLLAALLLVPHTVAVIFMWLVIRKQFPLLDTQQDPEVKPIRIVLFVFAILLMIGNVIPIVVDSLSLFDVVKRTTSSVNLIGLFYSVNNAMNMLVASVCFWLIYLLAERIILNPPTKE